MPRFLLLLHGDQDSEVGKMPPKEVFEQMHAYNADLMASGALLAGEGLQPTAKGARVSFPAPDPANPHKPRPAENITVTHGPFDYPMQNPTGKSGPAPRPVCGFWIVKATDLEEAVALVKKGPLAGSFVEVREIFETADLTEMPEQLKQEEAGWRKELEGKQ